MLKTIVSCNEKKEKNVKLEKLKKLKSLEERNAKLVQLVNEEVFDPGPNIGQHNSEFILKNKIY